MFIQFERLETASWLNGNFENMLSSFPVLKEFPHVDTDGPKQYWETLKTPYWLIAHEFGHLMQFFINGEEKRLLLNNFGWKIGDFSGRGLAVANRESEVFALQLLFLKHFPEFEGDGLSSLRNVSGVCANNFEGIKTDERKAYWKTRIEDNMDTFDNIFFELANKTFEFIVENKSAFCVDN